MKVIALFCASVCLFVFLGCSKPQTKNWEYKMITQQPGYAWQNPKELNELGTEGWELVAVVPSSFANGTEKNSIVDTVYLYLKRPKP